MSKIVVVGAGGFGREVMEIFKDQNKIEQKWDIVGFIDDNPALHNKILNGFLVIGGLEWLIENNDEIGCVVAIGDPKIKKIIVEKLETHHIKFVNAIHPSVMMSDYVEFGEDVIICAGAILTVNVKIGNHVNININSTIGHDTVINDYCSIMPTVKVSGNDNLCEGVYLGTGSTLIHQVSIGQWATIAAGTVVFKDIPENVVAIGMPAKVVKKIR